MRSLRPPGPPRRIRLLLPAVAVLVLTLGGCGDPAAPAPSEPPTPTAPASTLRTPSGSTGSDGLTVRYLDHDGTVKTVRVEDFPR
jgi:hypothetical protein